MMKKMLDERNKLGSKAPRHHLCGEAKAGRARPALAEDNLSKRSDSNLEECGVCVPRRGMGTMFRAAALRDGIQKTLKAAEKTRNDVVEEREAWVNMIELTETKSFSFVDVSAAEATNSRNMDEPLMDARVLTVCRKVNAAREKEAEKG